MMEIIASCLDVEAVLETYGSIRFFSLSTNEFVVINLCLPV